MITRSIGFKGVVPGQDTFVGSTTSAKIYLVVLTLKLTKERYVAMQHNHYQVGQRKPYVPIILKAYESLGVTLRAQVTMDQWKGVRSDAVFS